MAKSSQVKWPGMEGYFINFRKYKTFDPGWERRSLTNPVTGTTGLIILFSFTYFF